MRLPHHVEVACRPTGIDAEGLGDLGVFQLPELVVAGHVLAVVVELAELLEFVHVGLASQVAAVGDNVDVVVAGLVEHELRLGDEKIGPLEVGEDLDLVLVDGFHELFWPEPDVVELVHKQEVFLRHFLFDLCDGLGVELLEEGHHGVQVGLVLAVQQHRLHLHALFQLLSELRHLPQSLAVLVQVDHSPASLLA